MAAVELAVNINIRELRRYCRVGANVNLAMRQLELIDRVARQCRKNVGLLTVPDHSDQSRRSVLVQR
jgi:DNA topoisomerase VI subunit B